jgi:CDP-diacylglycerol--glycerol-3-phosphate 3-phosphatidyltransferase/cardiolipin synthase
MPSAASPRWIAPVPNLLTALRLALAAAFPFVPEAWRIPVVAVAGASDFLDGWIARRFHATSDLGRLLDGVADKAFTLSAVVTLVLAGLAPWWAGLLAMARDLAVAAMTLWCAATGRLREFRDVRPRVLGKVTTGFAFLWLLTLLVPPLAPARWPALVLAAVASVAAAIDYAARFLARRR